MDITAAFNYFKKNLQGEVLSGMPMSAYTTWRIGGCADIFIKARGEKDVIEVTGYCFREKLPLLVIGRGSNLLVSDQGIEGVVLQLGEELAEIVWHAGGVITAQAGVPLALLSRQSAARGWGGLEWAAGIPGSLGGALIMNAGAYDHSIDDYVTKIRLVEYTGKVKEISSSELQFSYRRGLPCWYGIILEVELQLSAGNREQSEKEISRLLQLRGQNQPLEYPSAGSVFKNPPGDHAGRLIEAAGCRGLSQGGAQVSTKHGNFIVNIGGATAADVLALMELVQKEVWEKFAVRLQPEVKLVGRQ